MKKLFVLLVLFLLVGCSNGKLEKIEIDRNHYSTIYDWVPIGISENGLYYVKDEILYFKEDNGDSVPIGSINYSNGEKTQIGNSANDSNIKTDFMAGRDLICYGNRIYMIYNTFSYDMGDYYHLASIDMKGEDFKSHLAFEYIPHKVVMNNGNVYVMYSNLETHENIIEIYDQNFELIETKKYSSEKYSGDFYIENDNLVVPEYYSIYENGNIKISNLTEIDSENNMKTTGVVKIDDKEFIFENKTVLFVNDKYFYIASDTYPQTYERYHLNGELDKAIVINEHIESAGTVFGATDMDFSYMLKLRDENIGYGYSSSDSPRFFEVNFDEGTCQYVDE